MTITNSKNFPVPKKAKILNNGRLQWLSRGKSGESPAMWESHWSTVEIANSLKSARESGDIAYVGRLLEKYLKFGASILEAGCGTAFNVAALLANGYDVVGLDFVGATLVKAKTALPELRLIWGNLFDLPFKPASFDCYLSLGVVEHYEESGPAPILREAHRVLKANGLIICLVPYFSPLRKFKMWLGCFPGSREEYAELEHYQFAFSKINFQTIVESAGFKIVRTCFYDSYIGFEHEIIKVRKFGKILNGVVYRILRGERLGSFLAHMMCIVAQKLG